MVQINITTFNFSLEHSQIPYFIISFIGTTSNVLLIFAIIKDPLKCFKNSGTYLVMNLSLSDLLVLIFHLHAMFITRLAWIFHFLTITLGIVSIVSIASISIDRFLLVVYPLKHRHLITGKFMIFWLSGIWLSSVLPICGLLYGNKINMMLVIYCFSVSFIVCSVVLYAITYSTLKTHSKNLAQQNSTESRAQEIKILKEKKFLKTIIIIACIAFFCVVPTMIYFQLNTLYLLLDNLAGSILLDTLQLLLYTNFAVNPLIYVLRLPNYRKTFYSIYWKRRC
jgi:uncharacterized membrane protein